MIDRPPNTPQNQKRQHKLASAVKNGNGKSKKVCEVKIFVSYSHKDELFKQELETHLSLLKRQNLISVWNDRRIEPGDNWASKIDENLVSADIVVILISSDFIASDYCYEVEMKKAFDLHKEGRLTLIPFVLRYCDWHSAPFGAIQGLPRDARPVDAFTRRDEAYLQLVSKIRGLAKESTHPAPNVKFDASKVNPDLDHTSAKRSSNLHIRRKPTDLDKKRYVETAFKIICEFVRASAQELSHRNDDVETVENVAPDRLEVSVFIRGSCESKMSIWRSSEWGNDSIRYSTSGNSANAWNGEFTLREVDDNLGFNSMATTIYSSQNKMMTIDECAEEAWDEIMKPLQR